MSNATQREGPSWRPILGFVALVIGHLAVVQVLPSADTEYATFTSVNEITRSVLVAAGSGTVIALLAIATIREVFPKRPAPNTL